MLPIVDVLPARVHLDNLGVRQEELDQLASYEARVDAAKSKWKVKSNDAAGKDLFDELRRALRGMCGELVRCMYCEDSVADEIEHIYPKNYFPEKTFTWSNFAYACGPCNGAKSSKYGVWNGVSVVPTVRRRKGPVLPPPAGQSGFLDPRFEDPTQFFELDLGGVAPNGTGVDGTFEFLVRDGLDAMSKARATYTLQTLKLNSELQRASRENAFNGYRARLREYVAEKASFAPPARLENIKADVLRTPHPTVFVEMLRQRHVLPPIEVALRSAPEIGGWRL